MADTEQGNQMSITEFILMGFGNIPKLRVFLFLLFLAIYFVIMAGNILIIVLVVADQHLHAPMYFFLGNAGQFPDWGQNYFCQWLPHNIICLVSLERQNVLS
ncbi:unnamed protein product [Eretmochelys imbricata]